MTTTAAKVTRATLRGAPYRNIEGHWKAGATVDGRFVSVFVREEHGELRMRDVINVVWDGMEWRAA